MTEKDKAIVELWDALWEHVKIVAQTASAADYEEALKNSTLEKWQGLVLEIKQEEESRP
jgi:hypothetical protein